MDAPEATEHINSLIREGRASEAYLLASEMTLTDARLTYDQGFMHSLLISATLSSQPYDEVLRIAHDIRIVSTDPVTLCDTDRDLGLYCLRMAKRHLGGARRSWLVRADIHLDEALAHDVPERLAVNWSARARYYMETGHLEQAIDEFRDAHMLFARGGLDPEHFLTHKLHFAVALGKDGHFAEDRRLSKRLAMQVRRDSQNPAHQNAARLVNEFGRVGAMIVWYGWRLKSLLGR